MRRSRPVACALGTAALLVGAASPAAAAPSVAVYCDSGANHYICDVEYSGQVSAVTIQWAKNGVHMPAFDNRTYVNQSCSGGTHLTLTATVTDASGSGAGSQGFLCRSGPWQ